MAVFPTVNKILWPFFWFSLFCAMAVFPIQNFLWPFFRFKYFLWPFFQRLCVSTVCMHHKVHSIWEITFEYFVLNFGIHSIPKCSSSCLSWLIKLISNISYKENNLHNLRNSHLRHKVLMFIVRHIHSFNKNVFFKSNANIEFANSCIGSPFKAHLTVILKEVSTAYDRPWVTIKNLPSQAYVVTGRGGAKWNFFLLKNEILVQITPTEKKPKNHPEQKENFWPLSPAVPVPMCRMLSSLFLRIIVLHLMHIILL